MDQARDIKQYSRERLGLEISPKQLKIIDAMAAGKKVIISRPKDYKTAKHILNSYVHHVGEYVKHFDNTHYRAITIEGRKFIYCPVGNICSWSEGDFKNKWCHWCKKYFDEIIRDAEAKRARAAKRVS